MINILNSLNAVLEFCQNAPLLITLTKNGTIKVLEYLFERIYTGQHNNMSVLRSFFNALKIEILLTYIW